VILTVSASQLSLGSHGDDVARVQQAIQSLGRDIPAAETDKRVFGPGMAAVLKALQADLGLRATGVVDAATVKAINSRLAKLPAAPRTVRGRVSTAAGNPPKGLSVQIYLQGPTGEKVIGKASLDSEGSYQISYKVPPKTARTDLRIEVRNAKSPVETTPPGTSVLTNAGPLEVVDLVLSGAAHPPSSEFELLVADLNPLLGSRDPAKLKEDAKNRDVSLLAAQSGRPSAQVAALAIASRLAGDTKVPAATLYGLLREGLPADLSALQAAHPDLRRKALMAAVEKGTVPKTVGGKSIESYLSGLASEPSAQLKSLLGRVLKPAEINRFFSEYQKSGDDPAAFWKRIAADSGLGGQADKVKLAVQIAGLTNSHEPLVASILARPDIKQASDLARLTREQWNSLVQAHGVGVPEGTPGVNADEKVRNYVGQMLARVEAAFPTQVFAARLGDSPVGKFLQGNPTYDLKTTYPTLFFKQNPAAVTALSSQQQQQLRAFQRMYRLTGSAEETLALSAKGIASAQQISRLSRQMFAERHRDILSVDRAAEVYDRALRVSALAVTLFGENAAALNRTDLQALPRLDTQKQADLAASNPIPDWQTLFGAFDACACRDCASVHSAAAYFVDALHFLDDRGARDPLFARRPDLGEIELSCENTDTPLPLVDLVNEILEDRVVPPASFTSFTLAPALEADLAQPVATAALTAAFTPPLAAGTRVDASEPGARWRIWDQAFAYSVVKDNGALKVATRGRQTVGPAAARRSAPQYRNNAAYDELAQSVFPWNLPFDLPGAEAKVFLAHLGVPRRDLIEALRPMPDPFDLNAPVVVRLAAEGLGLTDMECRIIAAEPLTPPQPPEAFWGSAQVADLTTVQALLDRSGLAYAELESLLATRFIDPAAAVTIAPDPGAIDSCDTAKLHVDGLTVDVLSRLHRFVRLWRKLGWQIAELDKAICALSPDADAPVLTDEILVRLDHLRAICTQLRLPVVQALAVWRSIDTVEPGSLYRSLFYNPAVFKPQHDAFRLQPDGQELAHTDKLLADHAAALQAAFRLDSAAFALLLANTDGALNLANLSLIYRHASLARQLGLSVQNLVTAINVTGIDPFRADHTQDTLRFIAQVTAIKGSGFDFPRLDYLLRHQFSSAASFVPTDSRLTQILTDVRAGLLTVDAPTDAETAQLRQSGVIDRVAAGLGLPADVVAGMLGTVRHSGATALQKLLEMSSIDSAQELSRGNAGPQFATLEKLLKIATVIEVLELPGSQLEWLFRENAWLAAAPDPLTDPGLFAGWFSLIQFRRLRRDLALEDGAVEALLGGVSAVVAANDQPGRVAAKHAFADALATWLGWPSADLETLIGKSDDLGDLGLLNARLPEDYRVDLLARLNRAMGLLKRLGTTAAQASEWCDTVVTDANAKAIRDAAKAKYDDTAWQTVAIPLQDSLRDSQRAALVAYLVARPAKWPTLLEHPDADDLYASFLIDVQMSSCQLTSRIKQAIGSVQLFAQRCLMGLEAGVIPDDESWHQWTDWMKNFRVWEANRKIWLYPENWIEPELRDDKSPFFKDLENELLQSDLDNAAAEQALMHYLEKLDQVAHLEIAGTYEDEDKTLHVFGRTFHTPRVYFYRRREGKTLAWTPWEKVELDIEGDHLIPVMWNRKLMLIWPILTEKALEKQVEMPEPGTKLDSADHYWEIQLAWSEYQNGRWAGKNLSEVVTLTAYQAEASISFGDLPGFERTEFVTVTDHRVSPPVTYIAPRRLVSKDKISFKAIVSGETLMVQGFLRRDYHEYHPPVDGPDSRIACLFGVFQFFGCRKIVTTAQVTGWSFPLAPTSTKFDHTWLTQRFTQTSAGLILFDVGLPPIGSDGSQTPPLPTVIGEPASIVGDPSSTLATKHDIPVLDRTPWRFRLLAPHQDPQFVGDRPFFFGDEMRAFVVSSTGKSGFRVIPVDWAIADVAALGMASPPPPPEGGAPGVPPGVTGTLTVLDAGRGGTRIAREVTPVNLTPVSGIRRGMTRFWTNRAYTFRNFHHAYVCEFVKTLDRAGIEALLSLDTQSLIDDHSFDAYLPTNHVAQPYPVDEVDFRYGGAYDLYNWELFFHIPLLMATRLSANQRFDDAQRWFHYIFDPTGVTGGDVPQRYWRTQPFHVRASADYEQESVESIEKLAAQGAPEDLVVAVNAWRENPFDPYAVARLRTTAFQKTVVMKYLDNLIAWGDQLFRRETIETLNEATQLYVLAAEILGRKPEVIERKVQPPVQTFNSLGQVGLLSNALEQIELLIPDAGSGSSTDNSADTVDPPKVLYFCVQENDKLLGYWSTVADRLFKIRHCMNIEGQVRQLPLFEPPIDPALLVRAQAAGLSLAAVLSEISIPLSNYRFAVMLQKANEVAAEVRNFGAGLLSVLEKRDAEALSTLRSGQELRLLQAVRDIRIKQIDEAEANIAALHAGQQMAQARKDFYDSREKVNALENTSLALSAATAPLMAESAHLRILAGLLQKIGDVKMGSPTTAGVEIGPYYFGVSLEEAALALDAVSGVLNIGSQLVGRMADYGRRQDEWDHQANLAAIELKQIDQQLTAAQIRLAVAERELRNHDQQVDNARDVDEFLRGKFTNQDLYQWMTGQVSGLYFQSYQLAYDLAKRAELCMQHELGLAYGETSFIRFGYWDSLKNGLLAGDHLAHDLKRLDAAYLDGNIREYELTKHVSLVSLAPEKFIELKESGACEFEIPEWLFDLDTPGHYMRRIRMVSLTIPCVTGPYTTIHCKAQLTKNSYRRTKDLTPGYDRLPPEEVDDRFVDDRKILTQSIVTSTGQNDAGLFEPGMRDERYLPFEGAGVISTWRLELPTEFRTFDYSTISDVILHLRYTARDGGHLVRDAANESVKNLLGDAGTRPLLRLFSLRHEFPSEWHRFVSSPPSAVNAMTVDLATRRFPYFVQGRQISITKAKVFERTRSETPPQMAVTPGETAPSLRTSAWFGPGLAHNASTTQGDPGPWTFGTTSDAKLVEDVFVIVAYRAT